MFVLYVSGTRLVWTYYITLTHTHAHIHTRARTLTCVCEFNIFHVSLLVLSVWYLSCWLILAFIASFDTIYLKLGLFVILAFIFSSCFSHFCLFSELPFNNNKQQHHSNSFWKWWWLWKEPFGFCVEEFPTHLFGGGVLGNSFGTLTHCMLCQFTGQEQTDGGLNFTTADGGLLVVVSQTRWLSCNPLKDVVDETVHDAHGTTGDTCVGMHLLQDFVDVDSVALFATSAPLSCAAGTGPLSHTSFLGAFSTSFWSHFTLSKINQRVTAMLSLKELFHKWIKHADGHALYIPSEYANKVSCGGIQAQHGVTLCRDWRTLGDCDPV